MTAGMPVWTLFDVMSNSNLGTFHALKGNIYQQLNEPGSGGITIPADDPLASSLNNGMWIDCNYDDNPIGGFFIGHMELMDVTTDYKDRVINLSGPGPLDILRKAIIWDWGTPNLDDTRYFNTIVGGNSFTTPMYHKGEIINQLLLEATTARTNPSSDHMDRQCFKNNIGTTILQWGFTDAHDTESVPWDASEHEEIQSRTGVSILNTLRQYVAIGQPTAGLAFEVYAHFDISSGIVTLEIYQTPIGVALVDATVHFVPGGNVLKSSFSLDTLSIVNAILVKYSAGGVPYVTRTDPTSITNNMRCEEFLESSNANTEAEAITFGDAQLAISKDKVFEGTINVTDTLSPKLYDDYWLGDWVYYDGLYLPSVPFRIRGMNIVWKGDDNPAPEITLELGDQIAK